MAVIYIKDLVVEGKHGFHPHEKTKPQRFKISVEAGVDTDRAVVSDDLYDTVNWSLIKDNIAGVVQDNSFNLVEKLAHEVATKVLENKKITNVIVSVDKMDAFASGTPGIKIELSS